MDLEKRQAEGRKGRMAGGSSITGGGPRTTVGSNGPFQLRRIYNNDRGRITDTEVSQVIRLPLFPGVVTFLSFGGGPYIVST